MSHHNEDYHDYSRFSLDIERGEEEETTPVTTNRVRPGSRATSSRANSGMNGSYRFNTRLNNLPQDKFSNGGIQILQDGFDDEDEWLLEDVSDDNEHDLESMNSESPPPDQTSYSQAYPTFSEKYKNHQLAPYRPSESVDSIDEPNPHKQLALRDRRDVIEVDTDEENDIVNKIKSEITHQVREEIKEDIKQITEGPKAEKEDNVDPRVKEALLQMRKYDRILEKRTKRERRVKRERIALQKKLRDELELLNKERPSGCKTTKDEKVNTEKFLTLPPSIARLDKEVAENSEDDDAWSGAPVFATEPPVFDAASTSSKISKGGRSRRTEGASSSTGTNASGNTTDRSKTRRRRKQKADADGKPLGDKDFIQRNIDLAADAGNAIAMTDDEKKRLADILEHLDEVDENLEEQTAATNAALKPGDGFSLDVENRRTMDKIDRRLESLMCADEYSSIMAAPSHLTYESLQLFSRTHNNTEIAEIGERALQETREYRDQQKRLADIERELAHLSTAVQSEIESPALTDQQLHVLLDQCNKMMSRATQETDSLSQSNSPRSVQSSTRDGTVSVQPHLEESVLKALLEQARMEGIVSRQGQAEQQPDEDSKELITAGQRETLLLNPRSTSNVNGNS